VLKLVPEIMTLAPMAAPAGLNPVSVGVGKTVKLEAVLRVTPLTVTEITPVVAPAGTVTLMLLAVEEVTVAVVPLNRTTLLAGVVLKFVPEIITEAPTAPLDGLNPVIVGDGNTVKLDELVPATPFTVTDTGPEVTPAGTTAVRLVVVDVLTVAITPLNLTVLLAGVELKFVPVIVITAPMAALVGVKLVIVGVGTVKLVELVPVIPFTVMDIGPVVAPNGTEVVILVVVELVTTADIPLNVTVFSEGVLLKLVPVIVTATPKPPLFGVKLVMDGVPNTVKLEALDTVTPLSDTEMGPDPAPEGTVVVMVVDVNEVTTASVPLNSTKGLEIKLVPVIVTVAPTPAPDGLKPEMVGEASTVKLLSLKTVTPLTVTDIFPVVALTGTVAVTLVVVDAVTTAIVLLNRTT
jgi:hypothetical protein